MTFHIIPTYEVCRRLANDLRHIFWSTFNINRLFYYSGCTMEKVIFREDYDEYRDIHGYLALFPDDAANFGRIAGVFFWINDYGDVYFESFEEYDRSYVLSKKIIHKWDPRIPMLVDILSKQCECSFVVVEKMKY